MPTTRRRPACRCCRRAALQLLGYGQILQWKGLLPGTRGGPADELRRTATRRRVWTPSAIASCNRCSPTAFGRAGFPLRPCRRQPPSAPFRWPRREATGVDRRRRDLACRTSKRTMAGATRPTVPSNLATTLLAVAALKLAATSGVDDPHAAIAMEGAANILPSEPRRSPQQVVAAIHRGIWRRSHVRRPHLDEPCPGRTGPLDRHCDLPFEWPSFPMAGTRFRRQPVAFQRGGSSCARAAPPARPRASCWARTSCRTSPPAWLATTG